MKHLFTLLVVAAIALAFWIMKIYEERQDITTIEEAEPHFIDLYINNFTLTAMDENGAPSYKLEASRLEHYHDSAHSLLDNPVIRLLQDTNPWIISARKGEIDEKQNRIELEGDVVMLQQAQDYPVELRTSWLQIDTNRKIAETDRVVYITQQKYNFKSDGMILNNETGKLELLNDVEGTYVR